MENIVKVTAKELKNYTERIEKLEQEKKSVYDLICDVYAKAQVEVVIQK
nr:GapR family DNA-binding domain-containing protein [Wolbachia endosymbiont of Litomosoides sigmodontis]